MNLFRFRYYIYLENVWVYTNDFLIMTKIPRPRKSKTMEKQKRRKGLNQPSDRTLLKE